jgi:probable rRNA maturation factor
VNDERMKTLNRQYRGIDKTTDVLSFPQDDNLAFNRDLIPGSDIVLGDIVVNLHKAQRQAKENGLTFHEELKRLLVHGLLHLLGYDHEKGRHAERKMKEKSNLTFWSFGIIRTSFSPSPERDFQWSACLSDILPAVSTSSKASAMP